MSALPNLGLAPKLLSLWDAQIIVSCVLDPTEWDSDQISLNQSSHTHSVCCPNTGVQCRRLPSGVPE